MAGRSQHPEQIMESQTRFDLNAAIENWRNELAAQPHLASDDRRELEAHLRDAIAGFQQRGLNDEESFRLAYERIGQLRIIGKEFKKVGSVFWSKPLALTAWGAYFVSLFLPAYISFCVWSGYECAVTILPWKLGRPPSIQSPDGIMGWLSFINYESLNFANMLMIVSPVLLWCFGRNARLIRWFHYLTLASVILVCWFYLDEYIHNHAACCILGCYVWIFSFVLLYLSVFPQFMTAQNRKTPKHA
jgi:hypothetical protein